MTEKRFAVTQTVLGSGIYDFQDEIDLCESYDEDAYREVCKKLNVLNDENKFLNKQFNIYRDASRRDAREINELMKDIDELHEEIEILKQRLKIYRSDGLETLIDLEKAYENNAKALNDIEQLQKEKKELKEENQKLREILENGLEVSQVEIDEELRGRKK